MPEEKMGPMERFKELAGHSHEDDHVYINRASVRPIVEDFERLLKGLQAVELNHGAISFTATAFGVDEGIAYVRIKYPNAPAFYGDTLGDVLTIALKLEEARR